MGCWVTPSTTAGAATPVASRMVGSRSTTWVNWFLTAPPEAMPAGQCTIKGVRTPPSQV